MNSILNGIVDLHSVVAIVLAAALMAGAFEEEYRNNELRQNLTPSKSEDSGGTTIAPCDRYSVNDRQGCVSRPFPSVRQLD